MIKNSNLSSYGPSSESDTSETSSLKFKNLFHSLTKGITRNVRILYQEQDPKMFLFYLGLTTIYLSLIPENWYDIVIWKLVTSKGEGFRGL